MTEEEVLEAIEKVVAYLAPSFKFGYYDMEDMKQEGTIFCIQAIPSFNFKKSSQGDIRDALVTFLKTHVRWRFLNMRRKNLTRIEPPLCDCELCREDSHNRLDCKKYSNWVQRNMAKRSLMEPFDVDQIHTTDASFSFNLNDGLFSSDVINILNEHIPSSIRSDYRRFLDGVKLPKNKRDNLISHIKKILSKHYKWSDNENRET